MMLAGVARSVVAGSALVDVALSVTYTISLHDALPICLLKTLPVSLPTLSRIVVSLFWRNKISLLKKKFV